MQGRDRGAGGPRLSKAPALQDFQFFDTARITALYEKEQAYELHRHAQAQREAAARAQVLLPWLVVCMCTLRRRLVTADQARHATLGSMGHRADSGRGLTSAQAFAGHCRVDGPTFCRPASLVTASLEPLHCRLMAGCSQRRMADKRACVQGCERGGGGSHRERVARRPPAAHRGGAGVSLTALLCASC